jgi:hypothetical protein
MWDDDDDDIIRCSSGKEPIFFYRVYESVTTIEDDQSFSNVKDFRKGTLRECKAEAEKYYIERAKGFESGKAKFHHPFASFEDFKQGENAAYSLVLYIVEYYDDNDYQEYALAGEDKETCADSREVEAYALGLKK